MSDTPQGLDFEAAHKESSLSVRRYAAIESALQAQHAALLTEAVEQARREYATLVAAVKEWQRLRPGPHTLDGFPMPVEIAVTRWHDLMYRAEESLAALPLPPEAE